jgi:hypothetical protein
MCQPTQRFYISENELGLFIQDKIYDLDGIRKLYRTDRKTILYFNTITSYVVRMYCQLEKQSSDYRKLELLTILKENNVVFIFNIDEIRIVFRRLWHQEGKQYIVLFSFAKVIKSVL